MGFAEWFYYDREKQKKVSYSFSTLHNHWRPFVDVKINTRTGKKNYSKDNFS